MNERIQQLAEQAHSYACKYAQQPDYNPHNPYNQGMYKQRYDSKFAELIVQDCTRIIANQAWESRTSGANGDWTEFNSLSRVAGQIKQHFGVEE
jgi:hypothetical protein